MSNRHYTERLGLDRFAVELSASSMRVRQHQKSGTEFVIGAFMWCVSKGDHASASRLRTHRRCVDADDEQMCLLRPAVAVCICSHQPPCTPNRDRILAHLIETGVDIDGDFSLTLDATGKQDVVLLFGNTKTLNTFKTLVDSLVLLSANEIGISGS